MAAAVAVAVTEGKQMMAAEQKGTLSWELRCTVRDCACFWRRYCSPRIPRVAPGRDYYCIPAGAVHDPAWSLLVGVTDGAVVRLMRLRVDRSGRILGRTDDKLEPLCDLKTPTGPEFTVSAALAPDGRSLCLLPQAAGEKPHARLLTVQQPETEWMPLPEIEETSRCVTISAAGHIWALYATVQHSINSFSVNTRRLVLGDGQRRWEQVEHAFTSPYVHGVGRRWDGEFLQGYAVLPDAKLVLVSFKQDGLFLALDLDSGDWTPVELSDATRLRDYVPILGRGVYLEKDEAVYMLRDNTIYAYKLTCRQDDQGTRKLTLSLPTKVDSVCPFNSCIGYGLLSHLQGRLMCSVWISLAWREPCPCDYLHAIVTTFNIRDPAFGGIEVLHSSYRRVDMEPNPADQRFCFLQEYEDRDYPLLLQEDLTSSQNVDEPPKMLDCCRRLFIQSSMQHKVRVVPTKPVTTYVQKNLFILCQAGSKPVIYKTGLVDESLRLEGDHGKPLQPSHVADDGDDYWHFVRSGSYVHAVSCIRDVMLEFSLDNDPGSMTSLPVRRPSAGRFAVVMRVGGKTIAMTDTLQVFHLGANTSSSRTWFRYKTDQSHALFRKVMISGYVVLNDVSFIVYDAVTCSCLLFELGVKQWRVVMPWAAFEDGLPRSNPTNCVLAGRCVSVDDFIYTCRDGGLAAYQLLRIDHSLYLSKRILLPFSWQPDCVGDDMCLDYAGKDEKSGSILFYVVQGGYSPPKHDVHITIVQVKTERTPSSERKPVGVDRVDSVKRFIHHGETIDARCCFAVS